MRIDAMNKVSQLYQANGTHKSGGANKKQATDRLEISQTGKDYQVARQAVTAAPDVREDRIAQVKGDMDNGTYNVSDDELAEKMLESFDLSC